MAVLFDRVVGVYHFLGDGIPNYPASNKIPANPRELAQISAALKHGLGSGDSDYIVVE